MMKIISYSDYEAVRPLAHLIKEGDEKTIYRASHLMSDLILTISGIRPEHALLVPVPGHLGKAGYCLDMAETISERTGIRVIDCLTCSPRRTLYEIKKNGGTPHAEFTLRGRLPEDMTPILIDNVIDTGTTALAAARALDAKDVIMAAFADTGNCRKLIKD